MKKYSLLALFYLLAFQSSKAQKNTVYGELLGASFYYSVNYERSFFLNKEKNKINGRIGFARVFDGITVLPLGVSIDFGKRNRFFQLSANRTFDLAKYSDKSNFSMGIGYVRRPTRGFYFHFTALYILFDEDQPNWSSSFNKIPWLGIGLGHSF